MPSTKNGSVKDLGGNGNRTQFPVSCSFSISFHKSQGSSLDAGHVDFTGVRSIETNALVYVALSRFKSSEHLSIAPFSPQVLYALNKPSLNLIQLEEFLRILESNEWGDGSSN